MLVAECLRTLPWGRRPSRIDCFMFTHVLELGRFGPGGARAGGEGPPGPLRGCPAAAGVTVRADAPRERPLGLIHHAMLGYLVIMFRSASPALKHRSWRAGGPAWELRVMNALL